MSYDIDTYKIKKLEGLSIPCQAFHDSPRQDWHPVKVVNDDGTVTLEFLGGVITGKIADGKLNVSTFDISGEGSGFEMDEIIEPALKQSTGKLEVSYVWEGGDAINKLIVNDGTVKWEDIEI